MPHAERDLALSELRERIGRLESRGRSRRALPFGVRAVDRHLPGGGLALDALHEVMETGAASEHAAVATLFVAGILARNKGPVLWCVRCRDLFAQLSPSWACMPIASFMLRPIARLRFWPPPKRGFGTQDSQASSPRSRGLADRLAAPSACGRGVRRAGAHPAAMAEKLRARFRRRGHGRRNPLACSAAPSHPLPVPGVGRERWLVELIRCKGAEPRSWLLECSDAKGRLALPSDVVDGSLSEEHGRRAAA